MDYSEHSIKLKGKEVFVRSLVDDANVNSVLLLHGKSFTSEDWLKIDAYRKIAQWGFNVYGIDYPGFGKSEANKIYAFDSENYSLASDFVRDLSDTVGIHYFTIVAPSMTGGIAAKSLIDHPDRVRSIIIVGGRGADALEKELSKIEKPVLIIWGENDKVIDVGLGRKYHDLIAGSKMVTIEGAGHAAYLDKPRQFFSVIKAFLLNE